MAKLTKVIFLSYGYFGPQDRYVLDFNKQVMTKESREALMEQESSLTEERLSSDQCRAYLDKLDAFKINKWLEEYSNPYICDGEQWEVTVYYGDGTKAKTEGNNDYPDRFDEFRDIFKLVDN